jgi:capsular polysaccharide biosynthesis protein
MTRLNIDDELGGSSAESVLVSLHFLRVALQRRWRTVAAFICAGALLALAALHLMPPASSASTALILAHADGQDPATAMATDVSLLRTRTVAQHTIDALGLAMTPDQFQKTVSVSVPTPEILVIQIKATSPDAAVTRLRALSTAYLDFRSQQGRIQSDGIVTGDQQRIAQLQQQSKTLTKHYELLVARNDASSQSRAQELLTQRAQADSDIATLQQDIQQSALETESIIAASHPVDDPAVDPPHRAKRLVLVVMSGLIGGTAAGIGLVVLMALLTNRLRRRDEVALALGRPVKFSARSTTSRWLRRRELSPRDQDVLAAGLTSALTAAKQQQRLAVVTVGAPLDGALVVARLARVLADDGRRVCLVDLGEKGLLAEAAASAGCPGTVLRPSGTPATRTGPLTLASSYTGSPALDEPGWGDWSRAEFVLVLGDVELGVGAGPLSTWAERAVLLVRAGAASAELLDSLGRVLDASGIEIDFAMLVGADASDESPGYPAALVREPRERRLS